MENTEENNKLIAEFMGITLDLDVWIDKSCNNESHLGRYLKFHTSWDWLMPVIKKAQSLAFEIMTATEYDNYKNQWRMVENPSKYPIENVYNQTAEFIKWYNENKED